MAGAKEEMCWMNWIAASSVPSKTTPGPPTARWPAALGPRHRPPSPASDDCWILAPSKDSKPWWPHGPTPSSHYRWPDPRADQPATSATAPCPTRPWNNESPSGVTCSVAPSAEIRWQRESAPSANAGIADSKTWTGPIGRCAESPRRSGGTARLPSGTRPRRTGTNLSGRCCPHSR